MNHCRIKEVEELEEPETKRVKLSDESEIIQEFPPMDAETPETTQIEGVIEYLLIMCKYIYIYIRFEYIEKWDTRQLSYTNIVLH